MKLRKTWLRLATARILAIASTSEIASGSASGAADLMLPGTMASVSDSSESWPTVRSMCAISASLGPMWRSRKASWCSSWRRLSRFMVDPDEGRVRACRTGRPSVLLPESFGRHLHAAMPLRRRLVPVSPESLARLRFRVLSDYGRYAFGAGHGQPLPLRASSPAILPDGGETGVRVEFSSLMPRVRAGRHGKLDSDPGFRLTGQ